MYIQELLSKKEIWIKKQLSVIEQNKPLKINLEDEVLLFGEVYSIDVDEAQELRLYIDKIRVVNKNSIHKCYDDFYKQYAKKHLIPRVDYFSKNMNLNYSEIKFRKMKSRWGS